MNEEMFAEAYRRGVRIRGDCGSFSSQSLEFLFGGKRQTTVTE